MVRTRSVMRCPLAAFLFVAIYFLSSGTHAQAATCTSSGSGNWNTSGTWSCGHVPTSSDSVVIANGHTVTADVNTAAVTGLTINSGGTLTDDGNSRTISVGGNWSNSGTFTANTCTVKITATSTLTGNTTFNNLEFSTSSTARTYTIGSAGTATTLSINGTLTISGTARATLNTGNTDTTLVNLDCAGHITITNTGAGGNHFTANLRFTGSGNQILTGSGTRNTGALPNVTIDKSGGTLTLSSVITVNGKSWTYIAGTVDVSTNASEVVLKPLGSESLTALGSMTFYKLTLLNDVSGSANAIIIGSSTNATTLTVTNTLSIDGTSRVSINTGNTSTPSNGDLEVQGNITIPSTAAALTTGQSFFGDAVLKIDGTGTQTITGNSTPGQGLLPNVVINKSSGTLYLKDTITCGRNWTYTAGTVDVTTYDNTLVFIPNGNTLVGSMTLRNLLITNTGTGSQTVTIGSSSNSTKLTVNNSLTLGQSGDIGRMDIRSGNSNKSLSVIDVHGDISSSTSSTNTTSTDAAVVTINGTGSQTLTGQGTAGQGCFPKITIDKSSGTLYLTSVISLKTTWTYTAGTVDAGTSTVYIAAGLTMSSSGMSFYNLAVGGVTLTLGNSLTASHDVTINTSGTLTTSGSSYNVNVGGNWTNSGTYTSGSNTTTFNGSGNSTIITGGTGTGQDFQNFTVNKTGGGVVQLSTNELDVDGTLTVTSGTLDLNGQSVSATTTLSNSGTLKLTGDETISATPTHNTGSIVEYSATSGSRNIKSWTYKGVKINGAGGTFTLGGDFTFAEDLNVAAGTFDASNHNLTAAHVVSSGTGTRAMTMGSGTWTLTGSGTAWDTSTTTNLTLTPNSSTIKLTDATSTAKTFAGGGKTFNNLWITGPGTGAYTVSGSNTFADFKVDTPPHTVNFTAGTTQTVTTFTVDGSAGNLMTLQSTSGGSAWNLSATSGTISHDYLSLQDSHASGGATFIAQQHSTNVSNNTGWIFACSTTPTASNNGPLWVGSTLQLTGGPGGMSAYSWTGPNSFTSSSQSPSISNVTTAAAGNYTLTVTDGAGCQTASSPTTVAISAITSQPTSLTKTCGESASFSVTATGSGALSYQWYKGTSPTGTTISGATSSTYNIASVAMADAGSYYVIVTDATCGPLTSDDVTLIITSCPCEANCADGYECRDEVCTLMTSISGRVTESSVGLAGVKITVTESGEVESVSTVTDPEGYYTAEYPAAWTSIDKDAQRFGFTFNQDGNNFTVDTVISLPLSPCENFGTTVTTFTGEAIQDAINEAEDGTTIFLPEGTYVIDDPIIMRRTVTVGCSEGDCITCDRGDCSTGSACSSVWDCVDATHHPEMFDSVRLVGQGAGTILQPSGTFPSDAPVIDATRVVGFSMSHVRIGGGAAGTGMQSGTPRVGLLLARPIWGGSSGAHHLENLQIEGAFSLACVLSLASEVNDWKDCVFSNTSGDTSGGHAFYTTGYDTYHVDCDPEAEPPDEDCLPDVKTHFGIYTDTEAWYSYLEFAGSGWNNMVHYLVGCYFGASNLDADGCAVRMQGANEVTFHSCGFAVKKAGEDLALAAIKIDRVDYPYNTPVFTELTIQGCHARAADAKHFFYMVTPEDQEWSSAAVFGAFLLNNDLVSSESVFYGDHSAPALDWHISGGRMKCLTSGPPLMSFYSLADSHFRDVAWTASSAAEVRHDGARNTFSVRRLEDVSLLVNCPHTRIMTTPPAEDIVEYRGYVRDDNGAGVSGVTIMASGVGGPFITDWNGEFVVRVPSAWTGELTPMILRHGCSFSPSSILQENIEGTIEFEVAFDRDNEFDTASYACVTAGSASSLQTEVTNAEAGDTIYVPAGDYRLFDPLDFSGKTNVAIIGEGYDTSFYASGYCTDNWDDDSLVNMSGSERCSIQRIGLSSHGGVKCDEGEPSNECLDETNHDTLHHHASMPQTALLLAGGGGHYFQAVGASSWWRTAALLSYKSEDNVFDACVLDTLQPEAHSLIISSSNGFSVNGTGGVSGGSERHLLKSCVLNTNGGGTGGCGYDPAGTNTEVNLLIQDAHDVSAYGGSWGNSTRSGGLLTSSNPGGLASIQLDGTSVSGITVAGTRFETLGAKNTLLVSADTASGVALHNNMMESGQSPIAANTGTTCANWNISAGLFEAQMGDSSWGSDRPMISFDTLTDSALYLGGFSYINLPPYATSYMANYLLKIDTTSDNNLLHVHDVADMDHPGGSDSVIIADDCCVTVTAWRSVRTHTTAGALAITLNATASGNGNSGPTSESRNNGIQRIEVDFSQAVTLVGGGAALTVSGVSHVSGTPQSPVLYTPSSISLVDSDTMAITFNNGVLPNETCYTINVSGAVLGTGGQNLIGDTDCKVRSVIANVNSDGLVSLADTLAVNAKIGHQVTGSDIKYDIDLDNDIDNDDKTIVQGRQSEEAFCP